VSLFVKCKSFSNHLKRESDSHGAQSVNHYATITYCGRAINHRGENWSTYENIIANIQKVLTEFHS
jgi:hypothetical protein